MNLPDETQPIEEAFAILREQKVITDTDLVGKEPLPSSVRTFGDLIVEIHRGNVGGSLAKKLKEILPY